MAARVVRWVVVYVPPRRRGFRLADSLERLIGLPRAPLRARHVSGYRITTDLTDKVQRSLFFRGEYEPEASRLIRESLPEGGTFLDVGANAGHYTFLGARQVGPAGRVHAFEASPSMAHRLATDVEANRLSSVVTVHAVAVSDEPGRMRLVTPGTDAAMAHRYLDPSRTEPGEEVTIVTVDDVLPDLAPDVVKVDVEGADLRALRGMRHVLSSRPGLVVVETMDDQLRRFGDSTGDIVRFMEDLGYEGEVIDEPWHATSMAFRPR